MNKNVKYSVIGVVLIIGIYFLYQNLTKVQDNEINRIKIGAIIPKTGPVADFASWMENGMNLGVENFNREFPDYKDALIINFEDSKFDATEGLNAFQRLRDFENVDVFISTMSNVSKPILENRPTTKPILLQDVTYPNITDYGNNIYRHFVSSETEAEQISYFIENTLRINSCVLIYQNDETGIGAKEVFDKNLLEKNIKYKSFALSSEGVAVNKTVIAKALEEKPECVVLFAYGKPWITSIKTLKEMGFEKQIITNTAMYIDPWRKAVGKASENVVFTHPKIDTISKSGKQFYKDYISKFKETPSLEAAYGYDLIKIIGNAYIVSLENKTDFETELKNLKAFEGAFGRVLIPENRDIKTKIHISRIINGEIVNTNK